MKTIPYERQARGLETMMNIINRDPQHIARSKAKARKAAREYQESLIRQGERKVMAQANKTLKKATGLYRASFGMAVVCILALAIMVVA